jgi:Uncharacterized conserved protein
MQINDKCFPCIVNQVLKVAEMTECKDKPELFRKVFSYLSVADYNKITPEIVGEVFKILRHHTGNDDPYCELRKHYNTLLLSKENDFEKQINASENPFWAAVKLAILGNLIDFAPIHNIDMNQMTKPLTKAQNLELTIDCGKQLVNDIKSSNTLLYLGDNCGEICLDKILIKKIKALNPELDIYFAVRGENAVNDSIEEDAYFVGIDKYAKIISNGDYSPGTVLEKTDANFQKLFWNADVIISKGQGNYECLNEVRNINIYFLLMAKCPIISENIGVPAKSTVCLNINTKQKTG